MDIAKISTQLEHAGYIVLTHALEDALLAKLCARCHDDALSRFQPAHIGRGAAKQRSAIRGDVIDWLDETNPTDQAYLACMEKLRLDLNESLFLGLFDYECHYAIYEKGNGYAKHSDVLQGQKNRILTTVLYLNEDWHAADGGELVVFDATGQSITTIVKPTLGTMIVFLSELFPHEVLPSHTTRRSIAGWFRVRGS